MKLSAAGWWGGRRFGMGGAESSER
jgi:hypothetical protein